MPTIDLTNFKKLLIPRPVPIKWPITAEFGRINKAYWPDFHHGTDFGVPAGTPINNCLDGTVVRVTYKSRAGVFVSVTTWVKELGQITISYCHLTGVFPTEGQKVKSGEKIALSGNTGLLYTGGQIAPHLHLTTQLADGGYFVPLFD